MDSAKLFTQTPAVDHVVEELGASQCRACHAIGQHRFTQRKPRTPRGDVPALTEAIIKLATQFGRYGFRRITALLRRDGWNVREKRVYRIRKHKGLKVPIKQPKRSRLRLNDGWCMLLRPANKGNVRLVTSSRTASMKERTSAFGASSMSTRANVSPFPSNSD